MEGIQAELINLVIIVLTACVGFVTQKVVSFLKKKGILTELDNNKKLVDIAVNAIEQTYKHLHGEEKMNLAKIELVKLMKKRGIKITDKELDLLIESSVKEMNQTIDEVMGNK